MFEGKQARFGVLVRAYSAELYRFAYWLCRERFTAEDLVQETYARAWSSWATLRNEHAAKTWLYTILRNEHARLYDRKRPTFADDHDLDSCIDERLGTGSEALELRDALHALPPTLREPLLLQVVGGFSCEEIAMMINIKPGAVMTRLSRARVALRKQAEAPPERKAAS